MILLRLILIIVGLATFLIGIAVILFLDGANPLKTELAFALFIIGICALRLGVNPFSPPTSKPPDSLREDQS